MEMCQPMAWELSLYMCIQMALNIPLHMPPGHYAQLEKEAYSLVYGVRKFHQYLYGREFTLCTHQKPLTTILRPKKGIDIGCSMTSALNSDPISLPI